LDKGRNLRLLLERGGGGFSSSAGKVSKRCKNKSTGKKAIEGGRLYLMENVNRDQIPGYGGQSENFAPSR